MIFLKQTAAFFDIDGTLYREGLITEIFKKLIKSEIIDQSRWYNDVRDKFLKWDKRMGNYDEYLLQMAEIYTDAIKGFPQSHIEFISKKVIEQKGDRVYTFTRDRIKWHLEQKHKIITISGSPSELVKEMSIKHGFHDYIGTTYVTNKENRYTGDLIPMWDSINKKNAMNDFVKKYNIDLNNSYAYGDTAGDLSMLNSVGHPYAINPTKELISKLVEDEKTESKIKIIVERKDMIYSLSTKHINY